jgi:hypothetical protein
MKVKAVLGIVLLTGVIFLLLHFQVVKDSSLEYVQRAVSQVSGGLLTETEIWRRVFDSSNDRIMTTPWAGAQNTQFSSTEIMNRVFDVENNRLNTSGEGGGEGSSAWADITAGTNTDQALVVGNGSSLAASGTGTIAATTALAAPSTPDGCVLGTYAHNWEDAEWNLDCKQVQFSELGGTATDAQIPHLNTLSTNLTPSKCVETDENGLLVSSAEACGTGSGSGVTDGDKGDITVSSSGATWNIDASSVGTTEIADGAVALADMANLAANVFIGRDTESTGVPEAVTAAAAKAMMALNNVDNTSDATKNAAVRDETNSRLIPRTLVVDGDEATQALDFYYQEYRVTDLVQTTLFSIPTPLVDPLLTPFDGQFLTLNVFSTDAEDVTFDTDPNGFCEAHDIALPTVTIAGKYVKWVFEWIDIETCWSFVGTTQTVVAGGDAPNDASYWTATAEAALSSEVNIGALTTGLMKITVDTGVATPSTAIAGTDYQAPIGNVTNDAQLKRAANDIASFTEKSTLVDGDLFIIEDSENSGVKKKVTRGNILTGVPRSKIVTMQLPVGAINIPSSNPAVIDYSAVTGKLLFDADTDECAVWEFYMPANYASGLVVKLPYSMLSDASGNVSTYMSLWAHTPGDAADIDTEDYDSINDCDDAAIPGTIGRVDVISCTMTNADSVTADDLVHLKVCRDANDATNDTATGDMEVRMPALQYVSQ